MWSTGRVITGPDLGRKGYRLLLRIDSGTGLRRYQSGIRLSGITILRFLTRGREASFTILANKNNLSTVLSRTLISLLS